MSRNIDENNFYAFRNAALLGRSEVVFTLLKTANPAKRQEMIAADNFGALRNAAVNGHSEVVSMILEAANPAQQEAMIAADNYAVLNTAAFHGRSKLVSMILEVANPAQRKKMIAANKFSALRHAALNGHSEVVLLLLKAADPQQRQEMIVANNFFVLRNSDSYGQARSEVLSMILEIMESNNFEELRDAAATGDNKIVSTILKAANSAQRQAMLAAGDFYAFGVASANGHLEVVKTLLAAAINPIQKQEMIAADDFYALRNAAENGHSQVVLKILEATNPLRLEEIVTIMPHPLQREVQNIVNLQNLETAESDLDYKKSDHSFVREIMRQTYVAIVTEFRGDQENPLTLQQTQILEALTRRVGAYIYSNISEIESARNIALAFGGVKAEEKTSLLDLSLLQTDIAKCVLPSFQKITPSDLSIPQENDDLKSANAIALGILNRESLTAEEISANYVKGIRAAVAPNPTIESASAGAVPSAAQKSPARN